MQCEKPLSKTPWLMRAASSLADAESAGLLASLQRDTTRPIYLLFREAALNPQVFISRLRAIYEAKNVRFSVLSEKPGRLVICAWLCSETTKSESLPSSGGDAVSSKCQL
jgi:hypothetical protein